jgi:hypothetical protein
MKKCLMVLMLSVLAISYIVSIPAMAENSVQQTWVKLRGLATAWGTTPVVGWVQAHARMVDANDANDTYREWASAHAIWSEQPRHINCTNPPTEDFTYIYYCAHLVNSSIIELNYSGNDFYISGLWNVYQVTVEYDVDETGALLNFTLSYDAIVVNGEGELRVFNDWTDFSLSITGIDALTGWVVAHYTGSMEINICDVNGNGQVNLEDLVGVAKRYGAMPGLGNYSFEMDLNFDFQIDVGDLTTIAANIGP